MTSGFHDEGYGFDAFGLHPPSVATAVRLARPLLDSYFRVESNGPEAIPREGAAILVSNHGGVLPVDGAILALDVVRSSGRIVRPITDHFVPRLPIASTWMARLGVVSGTRANVKHLLRRGELIAIWPEGVSGPAKEFGERYRIQRWSVGFAELAIRYRAPVIPVAIVGAEESWPMLAKLAVHAFGIPYLPVPATPLPLPVKYRLHYGAPLALHTGRQPADADDPVVVGEAAARVRGELEALLTRALAARTGVFS